MQEETYPFANGFLVCSPTTIENMFGRIGLQEV